MRKLLSIVVAAVMLVSIFAISANAIILPTYTVIEGAADEAVAVDQTFDGTNTEDFTAGEYGYANVTDDGTLNLTAEDADNEDGTVNAVYAKGPMHIGTDADVARGQYVIEFDITKNDDLVGHQSEDKDADPTGYNYGVYVTAKRPGNEGTPLEKYGVFIPVCVNTTGETYNYKIAFDEEAVLAAMETDGKESLSGNTDYLNYGKKLMTVYETEPGQATTEMASSSSYAITSTLNGRVRFTFGSSAAGAFNNFNFYFGTNATSGEFNFDESDYTLDNIKIYAPAIEGTEVTYDQDFVKGDINTTDVAGKALDMTTKNNTTTRYYFDGYDDGTAVHGERYVVTFDACCDVVGQPLTANMASDTQSTCGTHIVGTDAIKDSWYTYKIYYENTNAVIGRYAMSPVAMYRKAADSDVWVELTKDTDYVADYTGRMKSDKNFVQFGILASVTSCGTFTEGAWTVKNIQVVPDTAIAGHADLVDGKIVADVNIGTNGARVAYAATYKEGIFVDAKLVSIPEYAESFSIELPYDATTADAATLYVWDNSANPKLETIDLLAAVQ